MASPAAKAALDNVRQYHNSSNFTLTIPHKELLAMCHKYGRNHVRDSICVLIRNKQIRFPYKRDVSTAHPPTLFQHTKDCQSEINTDEYELEHLFKHTKTTFGTKYGEGYITFMSEKADYENIDQLPDFFLEDCRMSARLGKNPSPIEAYLENPTKIVESLLDSKADLTPFTIREAIYRNSREVPMFKTSLAKRLIDLFRPKRILDFSAGWGERLIAAIAANVDAYVGFEPETAQVARYQNMINAMCPAAKKGNFKVHAEKLLDATLPEDTKFDLIFTRTPKFPDGEPRFGPWLEKTLFATIAKAWEHLEVGGQMALTMQDAPLYGEITCLFVSARLEGAVYRGAVSSAAPGAITEGVINSQKRTVVWIWQKSGKLLKSQEKNKKNAAKAFQNSYPRIWERVEAFFKGGEAGAEAGAGSGAGAETEGGEGAAKEEAETKE